MADEIKLCDILENFPGVIGLPKDISYVGIQISNIENDNYLISIYWDENSIIFYRILNSLTKKPLLIFNGYSTTNDIQEVIPYFSKEQQIYIYFHINVFGF